MAPSQQPQTQPPSILTTSGLQTREQIRSHGSQIQTQTRAPPPQPPQGTVLRLRGAHVPDGRSVTWAENVADNENMGKKSSKVCCIYHRPRGVDSSSDESSSSSDSDSESDGGAGDGGARPVGGAKRNSKGKGKGKGKKHGDDCGDHDHDHGRHSRRDGGDGGDKGKRRPSPNAYERVPKPKPREGPAGSGT